MDQNVGTIDPIICILLRGAYMAESLLVDTGIRGWLGIIALVMRLFRFRPAYLPFGLSTCPSNSGVAKS